jgi:ABC-type Zn uptake system ZnuABC Zn-binding protein ZnuA
VLALLCVLGLSLVARTAAAGSMRVVATTSDLASLAQAVAGDLAQVETIIPPAADPEAFEPRPSDLAKLKGA